MRSVIFGCVAVVLVAGCADSAATTGGVDAALAAAESPREEAATQQSAKKPADEFDIGDPAPKFKDLAGVDDKKHSLSDYEDAKAVAVVFTCNHCPVAVKYEDRLIEYQKDYAGKGVQLVAINVNKVEADKLPAMKTRAEEKSFNFPYLYDPTQQVGRDYGATVTPHVFLLDGKRQLAYVGPVDDNMEDASAARPLLRNATDAVLAGKMPQVQKEKPVGCGIKYE